MGRPAAAANAEPVFADVLAAYPADRLGDEAAAYFAFARRMADCPLARVLAAVAEFVRARGTDELPTLAEALTIIARTQAPQERPQ
ncbi:hypothetical protein ACH79_42100 [Bradyrhizobium sp. CCBAU 051011]|nr:hypothetical protein ACH79_42100 [Bradyrhizobium sp. CCBAU 051011]